MKHIQHGETANGKRTPEYQAYTHAKHRCNNPKHPKFKNWGGRGILFRFESFAQFLAEVGRKPAGMRLDRIDNDGHYEPGNVKWSTPLESNRNMRKRQYTSLYWIKGADGRFQGSKKANTEKSES